MTAHPAFAASTEDDGASTLIDEEEEDFDFDNQVFFRTVWDPAKWDKCPRCEGGGFERVRLLRDAAIIIAGKGYAPFPCRRCGGMKYTPKASGERSQA